MNRIDPAKVAEFFKTHPEIKPLQRRFTNLEFNDPAPPRIIGCCGLTSVVIENSSGPVQYSRSLEGIEDNSLRGATNIIASELGLPEDYAIGFACGWDFSGLRSDAEDHNQGAKDGREAYRLTMEALR